MIYLPISIYTVQIFLGRIELTPPNPDYVCEMNTSKKAIELIQVLRAQLGDEDAFASLYKTYCQRIFFYIRKLVDQQDTAHDIAQTTWYEAYNRIGDLRNAETFGVWLFRIARNQTNEHFRKNYPYKEMEDVDLIEDVCEESNFSINTANYEIMLQAIEQLSSNHKELIVLHYFEDLSYEEIATVIEVPIGTIRSRIHYAKENLKRLIQEMDHED